jgi:hypothetical protein
MILQIFSNLSLFLSSFKTAEERRRFRRIRIEEEKKPGVAAHKSLQKISPPNLPFFAFFLLVRQCIEHVHVSPLLDGMAVRFVRLSINPPGASSLLTLAHLLHPRAAADFSSSPQPGGPLLPPCPPCL